MIYLSVILVCIACVPRKLCCVPTDYTQHYVPIFNNFTTYVHSYVCTYKHFLPLLSVTFNWIGIVVVCIHCTEDNNRMCIFYFLNKPMRLFLWEVNQTCGSHSHIGTYIGTHQRSLVNDHIYKDFYHCASKYNHL